jgi:hypothetical protein
MESQSSTDRFGAKKSTGSYRMRSRKASNLIPIRDASDKDITNPKNSVKFQELLKILDKHKKQKGIIYSDFVNDTGLKDISRFLEKEYSMNLWDGDDSVDITDYKNYAILSGDTSHDLRRKINEYYNDEKNIDGSRLRLILVGPAGAEGVNLTEGRFAIMMGSYFHPSRNDQVKYRIIRHRSHKRLPKKDQNVQIYMLLADFPKVIAEAKKKKQKLRQQGKIKETHYDRIFDEDITTDVFLYRLSQSKRLNSLIVYKALIESSIDCSMHRDNLKKDEPERAKKINCMECMPNDKPLFTTIAEDLEVNNCEPPVKTKIKVKELTLIDKDDDGKELKFMYSGTKKSGLTFYQLDDNLGSYIKVPRNSKYFGSLYKKAK